MTPDEERALATLMALGQQGDAGAYEALLRDVRPIIRAYVRKRVGDVAWEEDAVQDVLLAIHRARHTWNPSRPFVPWFFAVVHSRLIDIHRRERKLKERETRYWSATSSDATPSPEGGVMAARELQVALGRLPGPQRRVIELLKVEEWSVRDVSRALGLSEANVRVIAHRGLKLLRGFIERNERHVE